jgi:hypothetical protein
LIAAAISYSLLFAPQPSYHPPHPPLSSSRWYNELCDNSSRPDKDQADDTEHFWGSVQRGLRCILQVREKKREGEGRRERKGGRGRKGGRKRRRWRGEDRREIGRQRDRDREKEKKEGGGEEGIHRRARGDGMEVGRHSFVNCIVIEECPLSRNLKEKEKRWVNCERE